MSAGQQLNLNTNFSLITQVTQVPSVSKIPYTKRNDSEFFACNIRVTTILMVTMKGMRRTACATPAHRPRSQVVPLVGFLPRHPPPLTEIWSSCRSRELGPRLCSCKNLQRNHTRYLEFSNFYIDTHNIQIKHQLAPSPC